MKNSKSNSTIYLVILSLFIVFSYLFLGKLFDYASSQSPIVGELLSASLAAVITVSAMIVLMKLQNQQEKDKEFSSRLFERKLTLYIDLLLTIFRADDDNYISKDEMLDIENQIGTACLISNERLVSTFSQFMVQIKLYGVLYYRSMDDEQLEHFNNLIKEEKKKNNIHDSYLARQKHELDIPIDNNEIKYFVSLDDLIQEIRSDLSVIEGNVQEEIEHFIRMELNRDNLMRNPNIVNKNYSKGYENLTQN